MGSPSARYIIKEKLAAGGMGVVYRVLDRVTGEERALKRMSADATTQRFLLEAFEREYQVLKTLDHPRIIRAFDYGIDDVGPYFTMELLDGQDMRRAAPLPYREACLCLRDVATSLALLHARRLVHRDLSPGNVRMTKDGRCKLLDFGALASFGTADALVGTPSVVAPEAFAHAMLDARSDLYSLGALAYWMLTGRHAYPARRLAELPLLWRSGPPPPSSVSAGIPEELDELVLSLLSIDPLVRPTSAAEVIARLTVIGGLPTEDATETRRLALSFLSSPRFVGRDAKLECVQALIDSGVGGRGGAVCVEAVAGMGRTRLLEEIGVRAELAGAIVLRVDASTNQQSQGTAQALALRLLDLVPGVALERAAGFRPLLRTLGREVEVRLGHPSPAAPGSTPPAVSPVLPLEGWFAEVSREKPLVIQVDNVEYADDASLGLIAALAQGAADLPMVVVSTMRVSRERSPILGVATLLQRSTHLELTGLSSVEMLSLARSLFGDEPNVERFAEWLYERTAGSPLHALEIGRQLLAKDVIRYGAGVWTLPDRPPDAELPAALGDALSIRIGSLSESARILAECLSLQRERPTLALCRLLLQEDEQAVQTLLDELAQKGVMNPDRDGYRFSSMALREALLGGMDEAKLEQNHKRLGAGFVRLAGLSGDNPTLRLQAGWHLIQGGEEQQGADTIATVTHDALTGTLIANLHRAGQPLDAALRIYDRQRRSIYERMPLLAALAQAGYYEDRSWGERYGDEALYVLEDLSGLRTARRLRPFLGRWLSLILGILLAFARFQLAPRKERKYSFDKVLIQLFTAATTLAGAAALSLDGDRTAAVAAVLEPFAILPKRLTPVGIYEFCRALQHITTENEALAYETFDTLLVRFADPRYYPTLPADARTLYIAGAHFARGSMAIFRADGRGALESADALDHAGLKLYAMIASQLRWLYYTLRGEFSKAAPHREQVELHAAHVGSVWQVETWQAASLLLVYPILSDIVGSTRLAHRLEQLSRTVPSLKHYARLAKSRVLLTRGEILDVPALMKVFAEVQSRPPRSYIGWAGDMGQVMRGLNQLGEHAEAKRMCEDALSHVTEGDREYVSHFLALDLEIAVADAALGRADEAFRRIDSLLERFKTRNHPIALGLLHETRARISWAVGNVQAYELSVAETERWFLPTETPALVARCKRLVELGRDANRALLGPPNPELGGAEATLIRGEQRVLTATEPAGLNAATERDSSPSFTR